jgi:glycosyltransferase involved in cell wall biosynthesis
MISIITAIYNQRAVNEIFWKNLIKYTHYPFELIIVDNNSTDGSAEFFESVGATVIRNQGNYSYPHSQNQGIEAAKYEWLGFLNNDIIVSPEWDRKIISSMLSHSLEVATSCGIEQVENITVTRKYKRRWQKIKNLLSLFGHKKWNLLLMHRWMYADWEEFSNERHKNFNNMIKEGFVGNTVVMNRSIFPKIGRWDERMQAADFDLYLRSKVRADEFGDIKPVHICLDVFNHHYIRLTAKEKYPKFVDFDNLIRLEEKWSPAEISLLKNLNLQ